MARAARKKKGQPNSWQFERLGEPVIPFHDWLRRMGRFTFIASCLLFGALVIGILGYHFIGNLSWVDALLEASMILGGMGAVAKMDTTGIKLFASAYALFSGFVALSTMAIILTPWIHRLLHRLHADIPDPEEKS